MTLSLVAPKLPVTAGQPVRLKVTTNTAQTVTMLVRKAGTTRIVYRTTVTLVVGANRVTIPGRIRGKPLAPARYKVTLGTGSTSFRIKAAPARRR